MENYQIKLERSALRVHRVKMACITRISYEQKWHLHHWF